MQRNATGRARLPFRVFLTIDSLPSPSVKLPVDAVGKERGNSRITEEMHLPSTPLPRPPPSIRFPLLDIRVPRPRTLARFAKLGKSRNSRRVRAREIGWRL